MIKILFVIGGLMNRAGAETVVMNYFRQMSTESFRIDFAVHGFEKGAYDDEIISKGSKIFHLPSRKKAFSNVLMLEQIIRKNKYDIVHSHADVACCFSMIAAKRVGVPIRISHSHNTEFQTKNQVHLIVNRIFRLLTKIYSNTYFACSKAAGEFMYGKKAYYIMNNAIDLSKYKYSDTQRIEFRQQLGLNEEEIAILSVARFNYQKNHRFIIDVFNDVLKINKNCKLFLVGKGEEKEKIQKYVKSLGIQDSVIFAGVQEEVLPYYLACDVFLMPSLFEGLPVTGVEAQATGLPCLFSNTITKEVKLNINTKYIPLSYTSEEWAKNLLCIANMKNDRSNQNLLVERGFDLSTEVKKLERFYKRLYRYKRLT